MGYKIYQMNGQYLNDKLTAGFKFETLNLEVEEMEFRLSFIEHV